VSPERQTPWADRHMPRAFMGKPDPGADSPRIEMLRDGAPTYWPQCGVDCLQGLLEDA
jgi:hypothetical protein